MITDINEADAIYIQPSPALLRKCEELFGPDWESRIPEIFGEFTDEDDEENQ